MKIREDIADMLRAGHSQCHIVRELHVATITVQRTREALNLPPHPMGTQSYASLSDAFRARTEPTPDGHVRWIGYTSTSGTPTLVHRKITHSAYRVAFRLRHGREPIGRVTPGCDMPLCVAGDHLEDRLIRERTRSTFAAIFGGTS
ncbi:hypothetical protein AB0H77_15515 [Streptomyces sp. NPDC050844]|uniref:hypothetical protein n=1 Tax=Streptomyces sp. NPDC050844 TaxID=3155790 RepID=UPI0033C2612D